MCTARQTPPGMWPRALCWWEEGLGRWRRSEGRETETETKKDRESSPTPGSEAAQGGSDAFGVFAGLELWSSWPHCSSLQNSVRPSKSLQLGRAVPTSSYPVPQWEAQWEGLRP